MTTDTKTKRGPMQTAAEIQAWRNGRTQLRVPMEQQPQPMSLTNILSDRTIAIPCGYNWVSPKDGCGYDPTIPSMAEYIALHAPYATGDVLWFAETWRLISDGSKDILGGEYAGAVEFEDGATKLIPIEKLMGAMLVRDLPSDWRSPATMPEWAARIRREVVSVRVERLQRVSVGDLERLGLIGDGPIGDAVDDARNDLEKHWNARHPDHQWSSNPWVFVYETKEAS